MGQSVDRDFKVLPTAVSTWGPRIPPAVAHMTKRHSNASLKKHRKSVNDNVFMEENEPIPAGFVQILIKKEHLEELQSILTIQPTTKDISTAEITSLCGILADCGILANKEN